MSVLYFVLEKENICYRSISVTLSVARSDISVSIRPMPFSKREKPYSQYFAHYVCYKDVKVLVVLN